MRVLRPGGHGCVMGWCGGVQVDEKSIVITTGSSGAFLLAFIGAFDAG